MQGVTDTRYASLSWGLFDEDIRMKRIERFGRTLFDTKNNKVIGFAAEQVLYNDYNFDPVAFAWNVDPLAHLLPGSSPYAAFANNPILNFDPDGAFPFTFHVKMFAPFDWFGGGFKGDGNNRRFTPDQAKFKIRSEIDIETDNMSVTRAYVYGTKSVGGYGLWSAESEAHGTYTFKEKNLNSHLYGNNDAATEASSDIDVFSALKVDVIKNKNGSQILTLSGQVSGDKFPAAEAFVKDAKGNPIFLGVSPAGGGAVTGPYGLLPGENKRPMMNVDVSISVNKDGIFQGIIQNGKLINIGDWNKKFEKIDPK